MSRLELTKSAINNFGYVDVDRKNLEAIEAEIRADERQAVLDEVINLFNEMRPSLATHISDFGDKLEQMNEQKPVDWSKVRVDTKIFVKDFENSCWYERHFAKFENGKVYSWKNGTTSFTAPDDKYITAWDFAKLAEEGEQNEMR